MTMPVERCCYDYDALDRLVTRAPLAQPVARRFYRGKTFVSELLGAEQRSVFRSEHQLLALQQMLGKLAGTALLGIDQSNSVLLALQAQQQSPFKYLPYGYRVADDALPGLPGFNGEQLDPYSGHYLLGNGYRAFNPILMRFNSPDSLSPFGKGGLNAYAYCLGDPVNSQDPTGHSILDIDQIISFAWVGLGFAGAIWGLKLAIPTLKAVLKGGATTSKKLAAAGAVGQLVASTTFVASRVVAAAEPDSPVSKYLLWGALAMGVPALGARISSYYIGKQEAALTVAKRVEVHKADFFKAIIKLSTATTKISTNAARIRRPSLDREVTRL